MFSYWQPSAYVSKPLTSEERRGIEKFGKDMARFFQRAYALVKEQPDTPDNFRDLSGLFEGMTNTLYVDFCHVTEEADLMVAKAISSDIIKKRGPRQ
jgi:hypothetical protein